MEVGSAKKRKTYTISEFAKPEIPQNILDLWQLLADSLLGLCQVSNALVVKNGGSEPTVLVSTDTEHAGFRSAEGVPHGCLRYCKQVMVHKRPLVAPCSRNPNEQRAEQETDTLPISFLGHPLLWPDGEVFGALCFLDTKERSYSDRIERLVDRFKETIETSLSLVFERHAHNKELEELRQKQEQYRDTIENLHDVFYQADNEGRLIYASPSVERLTGYPPAELRGKRLAEFYVNPEDRVRLVELTTEQGYADNFEAQIKKKDGSIVWISVSCQLRRDKEDNVIGIEGTVRDVSESKRQEQAIIQAKEEWERTFDAVPDLIALLDREHQILRMNKPMADRLGIKAKDAAGLPCYVAVHGCDQPINECPHTQCMSDGCGHTSEVHEKMLGGDFLVSVTPIRDALGEVMASVHVARDITDIKRAQQALRESEEKFRQLAENLEDVFWLTQSYNPKRIMYLSPAFELVWGTDRESFYHNRMTRLKSIFKEDRRSVVEAYREFIESGGEYNVEYRIVRADGAVRWIWDRAFPIKDEHGRLYRVAGLAQDITDRKADQERQQQLNEEIMHFAYIVSHDLRTPLVSLKGFSQEMRMALEDLKPTIERGMEGLTHEEQLVAGSAVREDLPEALHFIDSSVAHMDRLTKAILTVSRLGRRELEFESLNMNEVVQEVLDSLAYLISQIGAEIELTELPVILADRISLAQIFHNLMANAIKYADPRRRQRIRITGRRFPDETVLEVRDSGRGIEEDDLTKIFHMFERAQHHDVPGEGVGLAHVRTLVRRHGGRIWCESEPGVGSSFIFTIANSLAV
ncbi:PAS domain S-box protein [Thermodesulfobacteriota bacterium]